MIYILASRFVLRRIKGVWREATFALLNMAGYYGLFVHGRDGRYGAVLTVYVPLICVQYAALRLFADGKGWKPLLAFFTPILALAFVRYVPASFYAGFKGSMRATLLKDPGFSIAPYFVGLSYLAFRASHLVLEVRNGVVAKPGFWSYLGFCMFAPTMAVGPINSFSNFRRGFDVAPPGIPIGRAMLRVLVGAVKFLFLGSFLNQITYSGLLLDDHLHHWIDLPVAAVCYYLYLYCNFSGFCDMAVGVAGLAGIPVPENFQEPFAARNVKDFWNRWHITLSQYMRDVVFSPLSKVLARQFGPANVNHAVALTIAVVFLLVGVWHGVGWNYAAFGGAHALGMVVNHYYAVGLKRWLGWEGFKAYNANRLIHAAAVAVTFSYVAASLFLFANTFSEMRTIFSVLR
ncbi:MAG: hypothetical protein K8R23_01620 [Chthoniobacter sp.]|nr:hypothetical protein [Chthoniobacter sp.]